MPERPLSGRALWAALLLALGALSAYGAVVVRADHSQSDMQAQYDDVSANRGRELAAALLFEAGAAGIVLGTVLAPKPAVGRGARLATAGLVVLGAGGLWLATGRGITAFLLFVATDPGLAEEAGRAFVDAMAGTAAFAIFLPFLLCFMVGPIILGVGLWRAGRIPVWVWPTWLAGLVGFVALEENRVAEAITFAVMAVALMIMAYGVARTPGDSGGSSSLKAAQSN